MGEAQDLLPLSERKKQLVIFGQTGSRTRAYRESLPVIDQVCQSLEIEQILDIGQPTGIGLRSVGAVPLIEMGKRSSAEISQILKDSIAGFLNYDPTRLAKSTIFAAYCAHRLLPVSASQSARERDHITAGKHYWVPSASFNSAGLQAIADSAYFLVSNSQPQRPSKLLCKYLDSRAGNNSMTLMMYLSVLSDTHSLSRL